MLERPHPRPRQTACAALALFLVAPAIGGLVTPPATVADPGLRIDLPPATGQIPELAIDDAEIAEGDQGTSNLVFTVRLLAPSPDPVTVEVSTHDSTATTADQDYSPVGVQLTFAPGSTAESLAVAVLGDTKPEASERFLVRLTVPSGAPLADREAVGTITNDDLPRLSIDDARIKEGDTGVRNLMFALRLSAPMADSVSVQIATFDGTATVADHDYEPLSLAVTFPPGSTAESLAVAVLGDTRLEGNDWLQVRLAQPVGAAFAESVAIGIITNDERAVFVRSGLAATDYQAGTLPSAWGDFNADGFPDLPLFAGGPSHTFTEIPGFRTLLANGNYHGVSWCDYDRDGDPDLAVLGYDVNGFSPGEIAVAPTALPTPNLLLQNQGDGTFLDVAPALGMNVAANAETAVWGDFDGDGWPDLFMPYYSFRFPFRSYYFHNNGDGTFSEQAETRGVSLPNIPATLRPEGAQAADWNDDGHLDLYCASHLFINDGDGNFTDVREAVGLPVLFDEGSSMVDHDNDGDLDLYLRGAASPRLFRNDAGHFTDVTAEAGIVEGTLFWGDSWADVDNDGDVDLVQHRAGPARLMLNQGDGTFERDPAFESASTGAELSAWADVDGDGDLDVVIGAMGKQLLINELQASPHFFGSHLRVRVLDAEGLETAHGATVRLRELGGPRGSTQTRVVDGGSGYLGQNEYTVHFGVASTARYALEVVYPSPVGSRVVVDSLVNSLLAPITTGEVGNLTFRVYRDGRVERSAPPNAGVGPIESRDGTHAVLGHPAPMPARASVSLSIQMARGGRVALSIHDLSGRLIRSLEPGGLSAGTHAAMWNLTDARGASVPTGVYFCHLLVDGASASVRRVLVVR